MDYKALLKKYIAHIIECEGCDFVIDKSGRSDIEFTEEEKEFFEETIREVTDYSCKSCSNDPCTCED